MEAVQYTLYQTENPDTRFERIYGKITELEAIRKKDVQQVYDQKMEIMGKLDDTLFNMMNQMQELDAYKKSYESAGREISDTSKQV